MHVVDDVAEFAIISSALNKNVLHQGHLRNEGFN